MRWVKWKDHQGVRHIGKHRYNPPQPWGPWTKIMGVIARCEGNHETVVSYDATGVTWGFMQWTFTSGRLQKLLQSFKSIEVDEDMNLFDKVFRVEGSNRQVFSQFGFTIENGNFVETGISKVLNPRNKLQKKRIDDICMGRAVYPNLKNQKKFAKDLAQIFIDAGEDPDIAAAQVEFAKGEFRRSLKAIRGPLGHVKTFDNLLEHTWSTPIPGIFFNLWQNNPRASYRLFIKAYNFANGMYPKGHPLYAEVYLREVWNRLNSSKFGNWSFAKSENKSPRIRRIKKAIKEFYGIDLKIKRSL